MTKRSSSNALKVFSSFSHWYYLSDLDIFAPSKFIGYKETTIENYDGAGKHGGATQGVLLNWLNPIDKNSYEFEELKKKLDSYATSLGKRLVKKLCLEMGKYIY